MTVVPATTDDSDIMAARAAEALFQSAYTSLELQTTLQRAALWRSICGIGFLKTFWDPGAIDYVTHQQGCIHVERVRPFNIIVPDLLEEDIEKQPWVIHVFTMTPEDAQRVYQLDYKPKTSNTTNDILNEAYLGVGKDGAKNTQECSVYEVWIKPYRHKDFPNGGLVTVIDEKVVQMYTDPTTKEPAYPYEHKEFPFAKLDHVPSGAFYPSSVIDDLIPIQRELNKTRSQLIENKNMMSRPRYMAPKGSVQVQRIAAEPGQVVEYTPGLAPPQAMETPPIPSYVERELDILQTDMDDISGQHEISRGGTPNSQVTAATAISFLQEQDDSKLAPTIESQEAAIRKVGRQYLALVHQFWGAPRQIKVVGENQAFDALEFDKRDITGTTLNNDVRIEAGSALSTSKAARQAVIMDLMNNGHIDPMTGLERLEMGGLEKLYDELQKDKRQAERENMKMKVGEPIKAIPPPQPGEDPQGAFAAAFAPNTWDNHQAHIQTHDSFRKTSEFEMLPDEIKMMFEIHVQTHQQAVMAQSMPLPGQAVDPNAPVDNTTGNVPQGQQQMGGMQ